MGLMDRFKNKIPGHKAESKAADLVTEKTVKPRKVGKTSGSPKSKAAYNIIVRPLVTEKSAVMQSNNKYVFVVAGSANKYQIAEAVKELYGVKVLSVNVVNVQGKAVRFGRGMGRRSDYKKAVITIPTGTNISVHEGV